MEPSEFRQAFEDHSAALEFEHDLIDRKVTWLLTSQSLLFAALGLTLQAPSLALVRIVAGVGLALCAVIAMGLVGNAVAKTLVHRDYRLLAELEHPSQPIPWGQRGSGRVEFGVRTWTTRLGLVTDLLIPVIFAAGWIAVLVLARDIVEAARP